ncbi:MAG: hypothetical protein DRJ30_05655 [Candidatus Methanomethylicota archaeon]|nr:MAG: hypothetical protein DRJ30_05655 [Candidatus Verstraetearchaeota archaeon]
MPLPPICGEMAIKEGYMMPFILFISCMAIIGLSIYLTRKGVIKPKIRRLPAIDAIDEAVGRATELGRPVHYTVGLGSVSNVQVIAGLSILSYVARKCAEYDTRLIVTFSVPNVQPVVMDLVKEACMAAGKPENFKPEDIRWLSGRQFSFATGVMGIIMREKVAANLLLGYFAAESLIFAEAGFRAGAIQIAGTTNSYQIPFFVTTCDYTLISEELIIAGAYISQIPEQVGTIFGQDLIRLITVALIVIGSILYAVGFKDFYLWLNM